MDKCSLIQKLNPILIGIIFVGFILRFIGITDNRFIYFDEGMWLNHNRGLVAMVQHNPPQNIIESGKIIGLFFRFGLETAKPLWSFISCLRIFFTGAEGWYFVRLVSAISGCLTIAVTFFFVRNLYKSNSTAILSAALLAVLPSHLYYSQLGLQESFSTLLFIMGIYFYVRAGSLNFVWLVLSSLCLACVFLSNYRMIISPVFILLTEFILSCARKESFDYRKYIWHTLFFLLFALGVSIFNHGKSLYISFGWMFHQSHLAKGHFEWLNLLSYPYFIFSLETIIFALLFFSSIYFIYKKDWLKVLPFTLVLLQMTLFSFSQEKAARFLCVVLPFMAMAAALVVDYALNTMKNANFQKAAVVVIAVMILQQLTADAKIIKFATDYESSMQYLQEKSSGVRILSTQSEVQTLFAQQPKDVIKVPLDHFQFLEYAAQGYQYLIVDPQAYISYTDDQKRFTATLAGYLGFVDKTIQPVMEYPHFSNELLKRFVFDHNDSLSQSINFLKNNQEDRLGKLKIFNVSMCVKAMNQVLDADKRVK